jgi:hypothetical protein
MSDTIKLCTEVSIYNTPYYALKYVLDQLEDRIGGFDYAINKYTWDGKKPYEPYQSDHVKELRHNKANLLLSIRRTQKLIKIIEKIS